MSKKLNKRTLQLEDDRETTKDKYDKKDSWKNKRKGFKGKRNNDASWHTKNIQMVKDYFSIPFNNMVGVTLKLWNSLITKASGVVTRAFGIPAIFVAYFDYTFGSDWEYNSAIQQAATQLGQFVRSRNSGSTNYQFEDLFINTVAACIDIMSTISWLTRFFMVSCLYRATNRVIPKALFDTAGIDYEDFIQNEANYRGYFNTLLSKASSIVVPKQYPIIDQIISMTKDIYKDEDSNTGKEQLLMIHKKFFHIFDPIGDPNGGRVRLMTAADYNFSQVTDDTDVIFVNPNGKKQPFTFYLGILNRQIISIIEDDDTNVMMGDLIKAYGGEGKFWSVTPISESDKAEPVYSAEFCQMLHNATFITGQLDGAKTVETGGFTDVDVCNNVKNTLKQIPRANMSNSIVTDFEVVVETSDYPSNVSQMAIGADLVIDSCNDAPTPEETCVLTRWHNRFDVSFAGSKATFRPIALSSIVLFTPVLLVPQLEYSAAGVPTFSLVCKGFQQFYPLTLSGSTASFENEISRCVNLLPIIYLVGGTVAQMKAKTSTAIVPAAQLNNVAQVGNESLNRMHQTSILSLLDVPFTGKF